MFHVKHRSLLKLAQQPHPSRLALLRFDLGSPRLRHALSTVANVSRETSHCWPPLLCPIFARISLHTLASHIQCPMFHVKHLIIAHAPPSNLAFTTPHPSHSAPLSPRTFTSSDVSRETPVLPQECKRAAASPRKVTPPPMPGNARANNAPATLASADPPRTSQRAPVNVEPGITPQATRTGCYTGSHRTRWHQAAARAYHARLSRRGSSQESDQHCESC